MSSDAFSQDQREAIAQLVGQVVTTVVRQFKDQRRETIRLFLLLLEGLQRLDDDLRPIALALIRGGVVSGEEVESARASLAAELASHPQVEAIWQAGEELRRLAEQLDREAEEGEQK